LFALLASSCGHAIKPDSATAGSAEGGSTTSSGGSGNTSAGGATGNTACGVLPADDPARPGYTAPRSPEVDTLVNKMSVEQKIKQLIGIPDPPSRDGQVYRDIERSVDVEIGGGKTIRGYRYRDAGRGVNLVAGQDNRATQNKDYSTNFPASSARAASWDVNLEFKVGEALGDETMGSLNNMMLAPCMNIIRHPFWGRTQETYSEDMHHTGRMASALTAGIQKHVVACAKHYAANNVENNRANQNAEMDEQTLREIYGRHFEMVVREGGVGCIMASYNMINGKKSTQNQHLLTDILRGPIDKGGFGYRGLVLSDWWAMPGDQNTPDTATAARMATEAINAGLDIEVPWSLNYSALFNLVPATVPEDLVTKAAARVLEQKFRFNTTYMDSPWGLGTAKTKLEGDSIVNNDDHLALAEEVETKSAVLLANGTNGASPVLPIKNAQSIAVVGMDVPVKVSGMTEPPATGDHLKMASDLNAGDRGSSRVNPDPAKSSTPYDGIKAIASSHGISNVTTGTSVDDAKNADFVVVIAGLTAGDEGEEYSLDSLGDRKSLSIPNGQEQFINDVLSLNKPTAIIIQSGSVVNLPWLSHSNKNQATIWAGYAGQRQGTAFGKLLLGDVNPSGKMALAWPKESDMPAFTSSGLTTQMGYFFGYRYYDKENKSGNLVFPFGWGMSYTKYDYVSLNTLNPDCGTVKKDAVVTYVAEIKNSGPVDGEEVVMLFVKGPPKPSNINGNRPVKELKSFTKVKVKAGETVKVNLPLKIDDLRHWEGDKNGKNVIDNGEYEILVGPNASDAALTLKAKLTVQD
jgi:beta-glucosidase